MSNYTDLQLDALRELANIGSGMAGTALSSMIGRSIDVSVPKASALPVPDAVDAVGAADDVVTGVILPLKGDLDGVVALLFPTEDEQGLCALLGVEPQTEIGLSAMGEIGNIVGASYINGLVQMTGLDLEPEPPAVIVDMLGAIVASALTPTAMESDVALLLDSDIKIEGERCSFTFLLLPTADGVTELLTRLGVTG